MTVTELRKLNRKDLAEKVFDLKEELFNLRFQHAINQLENPNRLRELRRDIARAKTLLAELSRQSTDAYAGFGEQEEEPVVRKRPRGLFGFRARPKAEKEEEETEEAEDEEEEDLTDDEPEEIEAEDLEEEVEDESEDDEDDEGGEEDE